MIKPGQKRTGKNKLTKIKRRDYYTSPAVEFIIADLAWRIAATAAIMEGQLFPQLNLYDESGKPNASMIIEAALVKLAHDVEHVDINWQSLVDRYEDLRQGAESTQIRLSETTLQSMERIAAALEGSGVKVKSLRSAISSAYKLLIAVALIYCHDL